MPHITPEHLLQAYQMGIFPMAKSAFDDRLYWVDPDCRAILPLNGFHISRTLRREILRNDYHIAVNQNFHGVIAGCADRATTWINRPLTALYGRLHDMGHAHSLELYHGTALMGGLYGVAMGGAFFAESMFSRRKSASKIILAYLMDRLNHGGFCLCDVQFLTPHLETLGAVEITRTHYHNRLKTALAAKAVFTPNNYHPSCGTVISSSGRGGSTLYCG